MGTVPRPRTGSSPGVRPAPTSVSAGRAPGAGSPDGPTVRLRGVHASYGAITALEAIDLDLDAGSTTAIIGPNGSGKSTLLSVISGLVRPDRGQVEVLGRSPAAARRQVAHVLQTNVSNEAVPLTVAETVRMGGYGRRGAFGRLTAADRAAVDEAIERMRIGDLLQRQLHELSGGQRQRVYVAQGLAQQAEILLLDEPITGLDLVTQETITEVIAAERERGRTVVLTTHDVGTAEVADLAVLMATRIVTSGPPAEVLRPEPLARAYRGHAHVLEDGTVVLDESHHHDHRHHDQLGAGRGQPG